jgi:hypothetical protein
VAIIESPNIATGGMMSLRGYDAVHCAAAEQVEEDLVVAAGDQRLLAACAQLGISTADVNNPDHL